MILTVTPNPALDRIIFIDEFCPGASMRTANWLDKVGGKALDASVTLRALGVDTLALGFVAGGVGRQVVNLLDGYGIRHHLNWVDGETRISHVIIETKHRRHSHITAGTLTVPAAAITGLLARFERQAPNAAWVVAGGTLPPGVPVTFYRQLADITRRANVPLLLDSAGEPARAALTAAPPAVLKMNQAEFAATFNIPPSAFTELATQAQTVFNREKLAALVLTCGEDGLLAVTPAGAFHAGCPPQPVVNAAGAGDAASAALVWRLAQGEPWPEALRWAVAVSAASVLTAGTADCRPADIEQILPHAVVRQLN